MLHAPGGPLPPVDSELAYRPHLPTLSLLTALKRMFHPKLGSPEGAEVTHEQVEGILVAIAIGDRRGAFLVRLSPLSCASIPHWQA